LCYISFMNHRNYPDPDDLKIAFSVPLRTSLRTWLRLEAARRDMLIQDLVEEIVTDAQRRTGRRG
jgi:hypothetical protein